MVIFKASLEAEKIVDKHHGAESRRKNWITKQCNVISVQVNLETIIRT